MKTWSWSDHLVPHHRRRLTRNTRITVEGRARHRALEVSALPEVQKPKNSIRAMALYRLTFRGEGNKGIQGKESLAATDPKCSMAYSVS